MKEIPKKKLVHFTKIIAVVVGIYIFYSLFFITREERDESYIKATYEYQFHGVIVHKYIDKANRSNYTFVLNSGKEVCSDSELYNVALVNDSISKSKGELVIQVFRKPDSASDFTLINEVYDNNVVRQGAQFIHLDTIK